MAQPANSSADQQGPLRALRLEHNRLLRSLAVASDKGSGPDSRIERVRAFIEEVQALGKTLQSEADRDEAQQVLDYWCAELLISAAADPNTWSAPKLADFEPGTARESSAAFVVVSSAERQAPTRDHADSGLDSREQIRLSALGRQWRAAGKSPGYLLTGDALKGAAKFRERDPLIFEFVAASEESEMNTIRRSSQRYRTAIAVLSALALSLTGTTFWAWTNGTRAQAQLADLRQLASNYREAVAGANAELQSRSAQFIELQKQLDDAKTLIETLRKAPDPSRVPTGTVYNPITQTLPVTEGDRLAAKVKLLNAPDAKERIAVAQELVTTIRYQSLPEGDLLKVVRALVDMAQDDSMRMLTPDGRVNLLLVLSEVRGWNQTNWGTEKAAITKAISDLEARPDVAGRITTRRYLQAIKSRVDVDS